MGLQVWVGHARGLERQVGGNGAIVHPTPVHTTHTSITQVHVVGNVLFGCLCQQVEGEPGKGIWAQYRRRRKQQCHHHQKKPVHAHAPEWKCLGLVIRILHQNMVGGLGKASIMGLQAQPKRKKTLVVMCSTPKPIKAGRFSSPNNKGTPVNQQNNK